MLLAAEYGWRAKDITNFRFNEIGRDRITICFDQHKTGNAVEFLLLASAGNAIIDYVKHGRTESDSPYVIPCSERSKWAKLLSSPTIHSIVSQYLCKARVPDWQTKKHSSHSLRYSLATNMLKKEVSLPVISTVLRHQTAATTKVYLKIDIDKLRQCPLLMPALHSQHYEGYDDMGRPVFSSVFAEQTNSYLEVKVSAGLKETSFYTFLRSFDSYCARENIMERVLTKEEVQRWCRRREAEATTKHYTRVNSLRHFLIYLARKGFSVYVPRDVACQPTGFALYIYTASEVERYFEAVDSFHSSYCKKDAIQYPALFRILYCCGTWINETLGIRKCDDDLKKGPRIHDWRHHMTVYSFKRMADSGMDMYVALQVLSVYLGIRQSMRRSTTFD